MLALAALTVSIAFDKGEAQERPRPIEVRFAPDRPETVLRGRLVGDRFVTYSVAAEAGQTLTATLETAHGATYFNVYRPGAGPGDEALANASMAGPLVPDTNRFRTVLATSGAYTISVYMLRSAARRNERANFRLRLSLSAPAPVDRPVRGDFADGLAGGPDFFRVARVPAGDRLNIRREPSVRAAVVARLGNGDGLRNLGCRIREGMRWCRVETAQGASGWAAGRFLVEGTQP